VIRRALTVLRGQGVKGVWFGTLAWARLYRRLELLELSLDPPPALLKTPVTLDHGFLAETEDEHARARLERGERCFVSREAGVIVTSRWVAEGRGYVEYLDRWLDLEPGEVFVSGAFTVPALRGRGVSGAAITRLAHALADEGCVRMLACVLAENHAAKRSCDKVGYRPIGRLGYVKLGSWRRDFRG
jgi:GNAT superfamily N-acetyltransferase